MKTWQIRGALISKFYEQGRLQTTSHRFRACKNKKLNTINQKQHPKLKKLKTKEIKKQH
ncbi:hypothetical protein HPOKI102_05150 [Helicobacter pylori oki102]|nr:hypothetical protein HPOKI102_05150 [Helicobacter pylori oki102]